MDAILLILFIALIVVAVLGIPSARYGIWPGGVVVAVLVVLLLLALLGVIG